ncbi:glycosyltransferase family 2 protein [Aquirufa sp.]|jgi:GT2 family glycosyltransferase|uniref:glycosyltransferase family 2 protein n=1 Tax=Aquirufa sp. TaxID=2676249 RepID=UPI003783BFF8
MSFYKYKISIIVIHLGKNDLIINFLKSLYESKLSFSFEVIVIDNFSNMIELKELVNNYSNCKVIHLNQKMGYGKATNLGILNSNSEYILWCNNDLLFTEKSIDRLVNFLDSNHNFAIAGPQLYNIDNTKQESGSQFDINLFSLLLEKIKLLKLAKLYVHKINKFQDCVKVTTGACCLIRRDSLLKIGGLIDDNFYMYCEEFDLSYVLRKNGFKIGLIAESKVFHLGGQTTSNTSINFLLQSYKSKFYYLKKHFNFFSIIAFTIFLVFFSLGSILYNSLLLFFRFSDRTNIKLKILFNFYLLKLILSKEKFNSSNLVKYYDK